MPFLEEIKWVIIVTWRGLWNLAEFFICKYYSKKKNNSAILAHMVRDEHLGKWLFLENNILLYNYVFYFDNTNNIEIQFLYN